MRKNNFSRPTENEPAIELSCAFDTDQSRWEFEENFKILQHSSYRKTCKAYYIENGNVPDDDGITFTLQGTEEQIEAALTAEGYDRDEIKAMIPGEPLDILETLYGESISILNYEDFNTVYAPLQVIPSKALVCVSVTGYSQGDYAEVFYCPEDLEKAWGNKPVENDLQKMFNRLFYDAPIYCRFTIDGDEYDYSELMPDNYEWDREAFAKIVSDNSKVDYETILNFLPQYPDYN